MVVVKPLLDLIDEEGNEVPPSSMADATHFKIKKSNFVFYNPIDETRNAQAPDAVSTMKVTSLLSTITHPAESKLKANIETAFNLLQSANTSTEQLSANKEINLSIQAMIDHVTNINLQHSDKLYNQLNTIKQKLFSLPLISDKADSRKAIATEVKEAQSFLHVIFRTLINDSNIYLYNQYCHEEVLRPLILKADDSFGMYVSPWRSDNGDYFEFTGFKRFVMAGYLYGPSITGRDQYCGNLLLENHPKFFPGQKIIKNLILPAPMV